MFDHLPFIHLKDPSLSPPRGRIKSGYFLLELFELLNSFN